jgi:CTP synthase
VTNNRHDRLFDTVSIALVGKYTNLKDSYISVVKSLEHASLRCNVKLDLHWVDSSDLEAETLNTSPVKYHTAWKSLCSAEYTQISTMLTAAVYLYLVDSVFEARKA